MPLHAGTAPVRNFSPRISLHAGFSGIQKTPSKKPPKQPHRALLNSCVCSGHRCHIYFVTCPGYPNKTYPLLNSPSSLPQSLQGYLPFSAITPITKSGSAGKNNLTIILPWMISILSMPQQDCISDSILPHPDQKRMIWFRYIIVSIIRHPTTKCTYQFRIAVLLFIINRHIFSNLFIMHHVSANYAAYRIHVLYTPINIFLFFNFISSLILELKFITLHPISSIK